jgi:hypothetical protein
MRSRLRWAALGAAVVIGVPAVRLWCWSALLAVFVPRERDGSAPAPVAPGPELVATFAPVVVSVGAVLPPLPPRADYRRAPGRLAPHPVAPGAPAEPVGARGPVELPPAPAPSTWDQVEIVSPFGAGTPAPAVTAAVRASLRPRLAECFDRGMEGRWAGLGRAFSSLAPGEAASLGPAILMLEVEQDGGALRVVDAPVERRGSASDGTLNCAQGVLRGATLDASSEGKRRFRVRFQLRP